MAPELLRRLLEGAHHAPSVGFMQPWRFIRVRDGALRQRLHDVIERERVLTARALGEREDAFMRLKVQGVLDAAELLAVSLADGRERHVFGRRTLPQMDLASASCAIQNLWLAARAEGLGMGWVSLFDPAEVSALLGLPEGAEPIALLCLGPVHDFYEEPMLQRERWARREPLSALVFDERWGQPSDLFPPRLRENDGSHAPFPLEHALAVVAALWLALAIDCWLGEPAACWHPVVWMGQYLGWIGSRIAPPAAKAKPRDLPLFLIGALAWCVGAMCVGVVAAGVQAAMVQWLPAWALAVAMAFALETAFRVAHAARRSARGRGGAGRFARCGARAAGPARQPRCLRAQRARGARKRHRIIGREP